MCITFKQVFTVQTSTTTIPTFSLKHFEATYIRSTQRTSRVGGFVTATCSTGYLICANRLPALQQRNHCGYVKTEDRTALCGINAAIASASYKNNRRTNSDSPFCSTFPGSTQTAAPPCCAPTAGWVKTGVRK